MTSTRGWFTGRQPRWRRAVAMAVATCNRALDALPPARALYRAHLRRLRPQPVALATPRLRPDLHGLRIAFLSDLHLGSYLRPDDLRPLFAALADCRPDLIALGGDLVHTRRWEVEAWAGLLPLLPPAPLGTFAVPGNHERFGRLDVGRWTAVLEAGGVSVLTNRGRRLHHRGAPLWLAGVDEPDEGEPDVDAALRGRSEGEFCVLLSHHPDLSLPAAQRGVDLVLSGHTHGGQVRPLGATLLRHSRHGHLAGVYHHGDTRLYVGRGIGASILPLRWNAAAELPVIELVAPAAADATRPQPGAPLPPAPRW